jgi:hypothetical protein
VTIEDTETGALRKSVILVAAIGIVGLAAELVVERHWGTPVRYVPWLTLAALGWAVFRLWRGPTPRQVRAARVIAVAAMAAAGLGIALHINENYTAGPLDQTYSLIWDAMSEPQRWWAAFSKSLGPAPTFAPGALALIGLLVLVATQRHPAMPAAGTPSPLGGRPRGI